MSVQFSTSQVKSLMTKLEYLMVYTQAGLPIYSKCYGTFCKTAFKQPELLSGFLSALETMPLTLGDGLSLQSVQMGATQMRFAKTTPDGHSIVVGLSEDNQDAANDVFIGVEAILKQDKFSNIDWSIITSNLMKDFETELLESALIEAMHGHGGFHDECSLGDMCPMHTTAIQSRTSRIWGSIKQKYADMKARMPK